MGQGGRMGRDHQGISSPWAACSQQAGRACVGWVEKFFKDCVCSLRDETSFGLGMASLVFWGVAEIPQIITNFQTKSGHGVSLGLLLAWVVGDIFNLVGCLLETATLPTQLYTAMLYTMITVVLVVQTLYYDYVRRWWKCRSFQINPDPEVEEGNKNPVKKRPTSNPTTPILLPATSSSMRRDVYYTSARSLANSGTPTFGSYLGATAARSDPAGRGAALLDDDASSDEEGSPTRRHRGAAAGTGGGTSRSVGYGTFIAISASLPFQTRAFMETYLTMPSKSSLQETSMETNPYGIWLGWIMAAIYMGGRLPQIFLNIKRGSVEGLNPLMFMLALLANVTYVGSILVRSMEWNRIKANAPWLLDAVVCVLLDLFILLQFAYYKFAHRRRTRHRAIDFGDYVEIKKPSS